jgi:hypothetical protein
VPFFCYTFLLKSLLIKSLAQSTHPWIGDYRNQPLDSKLTSTECVVGTIDSVKIIDACLLASFLACWLALQSKAATAEK